MGLLISFIGLFAILYSGYNTVKADSSINDYIISNKIEPVAIQDREGTFSHWNAYENGVGKPEGVVVHETADPHATANAENEASYFNNYWPTIYTYVHAFVDDKETINIHNTDYGVWGAGQTANAKYVQVELCEVHSYDAFARSLSNDAYYVASKLIQYNLPDIPGQTVVSHDQVSKMYRETDHTDPTGYFATWGYSMDQFNELISSYYNNLKSYGSVYNNGSSANNNSNVINVNNSDGYYVPIVAFQSDGSVTTIRNRALMNNTPWVTDKTKEYNGVTYHRVATNEWVSSEYII